MLWHLQRPNPSPRLFQGSFIRILRASGCPGQGCGQDRLPSCQEPPKMGVHGEERGWRADACVQGASMPHPTLPDLRVGSVYRSGWKQSAMHALVKPDAMHIAELLCSKSILSFCTGGRCPGCHTAAAQENLSRSGESCWLRSRHACAMGKWKANHSSARVTCKAGCCRKWPKQMLIG